MHVKSDRRPLEYIRWTVNIEHMHKQIFEITSSDKRIKFYIMQTLNWLDQHIPSPPVIYYIYTRYKVSDIIRQWHHRHHQLINLSWWNFNWNQRKHGWTVSFHFLYHIMLFFASINNNNYYCYKFQILNKKK